jgi:TPP-dependent pyruvate/acetoin dehydrogenase alpha subunit
MTAANICMEQELQDIWDSVEKEVQDAIEFSKAAPYPDPDEFFRMDTMMAVN